jgi:hypothetical protein
MLNQSFMRVSSVLTTGRDLNDSESIGIIKRISHMADANISLASERSRQDNAAERERAILSSRNLCPEIHRYNSVTVHDIPTQGHGTYIIYSVRVGIRSLMQRFGIFDCQMTATPFSLQTTFI